MPSPRLIPYRAEHLLAFNTRGMVVREEIELAVKKEKGPAWTVVKDDKILGAAGLVFAHQGVACAWMNLSEDIFNYPLWVTRNVKRLLDDYFRIYRLHRIEAVVVADSDRDKKWIEALGFRCEGGVAHAYTTDKADALRYEMVKE